MAEAALRNDHGFDSAIDRLLMSRPLRLVDTSSDETVVLHPAAREQVADSAEVARLKFELVVLKAALRAEQDELARLRNCVKAVADPEPLTPEALAVHMRWSTLVDRLLHVSR